MKKDIILVGGGGHAKVMIDIIESSNLYTIRGISDYQQGHVLHIPILGNDDVLKAYYQQGVRYACICVGGIGNPKKRWDIYQQLKQIGYELPICIHEKACVSPYARLEEGTCVMPGAVVNADVHVGKLAIINTGSIIEHDCILADNVHVSPGACLCGGVQVGHNTHIGAKAVVNQGIRIGEHVTVGSGSVVIRHVKDYQTVVGSPAYILDKR